jgi:hypothetical protein
MMYPQKKLLKHAFKSFKHTRSLYTFHVRNSPLLGSVLPMAIVLRGAHESMSKVVLETVCKAAKRCKRKELRCTRINASSPLRFKKN